MEVVAEQAPFSGGHMVYVGQGGGDISLWSWESYAQEETVVERN